MWIVRMAKKRSHNEIESINDVFYLVFQRLLLAMWILSCSCLCKVCSHDSEALMSAMWILLYSCLCKVCSHDSEALMLTLRTLSCSFLKTVCSSDSKTHLRFIVCNLPISAVHCTYLFNGRHNRIHKLPSSHAILCYTVGIPFSDAYWFPFSHSVKL